MTAVGNTGGEFWASIGQAPVTSRGARQFAPSMATWAANLNEAIKQNWSRNPNDYVGNAGLAQMVLRYSLTADKLVTLWKLALANLVDPRLLLAILRQEGTGSFDTNERNKRYFNGHGPEPDWMKDLQAALEGPILAKIRLYPFAVRDGFPGTWVEYVNWYTPIDSANMKGAPGVYAADINWASKVARFYGEVASFIGEASVDPVRAYSDWMGQNVQLFKPRYSREGFRFVKGLHPEVERPSLAVWHEPGKSDKPRANAYRDGDWWMFPAPDEYCWYLKW